jgi:hypothetical protein
MLTTNREFLRKHPVCDQACDARDSQGVESMRFRAPRRSRASSCVTASRRRANSCCKDCARSPTGSGARMTRKTPCATTRCASRRGGSSRRSRRRSLPTAPTGGS